MESPFWNVEVVLDEELRRKMQEQEASSVVPHRKRPEKPNVTAENSLATKSFASQVQKNRKETVRPGKLDVSRLTKGQVTASKNEPPLNDTMKTRSASNAARHQHPIVNRKEMSMSSTRGTENKKSQISHARSVQPMASTAVSRPVRRQRENVSGKGTVNPGALEWSATTETMNKEQSKQTGTYDKTGKQGVSDGGKPNAAATKNKKKKKSSSQFMVRKDVNGKQSIRFEI